MGQVSNRWQARQAFISPIKVILGCLLCLFLLTTPLFADDEKPEDAYQAAWASVLELLQQREYGNAISLLESEAEKSELRDFEKQIESDRTAIAGLQDLERLVLEQAAKLAAGHRIEINGGEYRVVRYQKSAKGDELVLKSAASGKEVRKPVADLPSSTWLELAGEKLSSLKKPSLTQGIFLSVDRSSDLKGARKLLNTAASEGADVSVWLARIQAREASKKQPATEGTAKADPVVGNWNLRFGNGLTANVEFRTNGAATFSIPLQTLVEMRKRKMAPPVNNPEKGKWVKDADGSYRVTFTSGFTGQFVVAGDKLGPPLGDDPKKVSGTRQVKN